MSQKVIKKLLHQAWEAYSCFEKFSLLAFYALKYSPTTFIKPLQWTHHITTKELFSRFRRPATAILISWVDATYNLALHDLLSSWNSFKKRTTSVSSILSNNLLNFHSNTLLSHDIHTSNALFHFDHVYHTSSLLSRLCAKPLWFSPYPSWFLRTNFVDTVSP